MGHVREHEFTQEEHLPSIQACFEADFTAFSRVAGSFAEFRRSAGLGLYSRQKGRHVSVEVHPRTRIPDELLSGPHNEEKIRRLFWLVKGGARLSVSQSWEVSHHMLCFAPSSQFLTHCCG